MSRRAHLIRQRRAMARKLNQLAIKMGEQPGWIDHGDLGVAFHTGLGIFFTAQEADIRRAEERAKWKMGHAREEHRQFEIDVQRAEKERLAAEQKAMRDILGPNSNPRLTRVTPKGDNGR